MIPDGVSRNPVDRDLLILARIGEWAQHRSNIRGIASGLESGEYDDEDPPIYSKEALAKELAAVQKREKETPTPDREVGKGGHRTGWGEPLKLPDKPWSSKKPKPRPHKPPKDPLKESPGEVTADEAVKTAVEETKVRFHDKKRAGASPIPPPPDVVCRDYQVRTFRTTLRRGPRWDKVLARSTVDLNTGEVLEDAIPIATLADKWYGVIQGERERNLETTFHLSLPEKVGGKLKSIMKPAPDIPDAKDVERCELCDKAPTTRKGSRSTVLSSMGTCRRCGINLCAACLGLGILCCCARLTMSMRMDPVYPAVAKAGKPYGPDCEAGAISCFAASLGTVEESTLSRGHDQISRTITLPQQTSTILFLGPFAIS